jgi:hypothetical protein
MLLLDKNNEPTCTVYYLSAVIYSYLANHDGCDMGQSYKAIVHDLIKRDIKYEFYLMALDFLFLLNRLDVDKEGGLHVH